MFTKIRLNKLLDQVRKPAQYLGNERHSVHKRRAELKIALCYPELYEIGMSSTGFMLLYALLNNDDRMGCERAFMPNVDYVELLKKKCLPLTTLESKTALSRFDIVGFSLAYELTYANAVSMLKLAGIPFLSIDRDSLTPLVIAGGGATVNPEPMASFFDLFIIGDGEEVLPELSERLIKFKKSSNGAGKKAFLRSVLDIKGVYVPRFYKRDKEGVLAPTITHAPAQIEKAALSDIKNSFFPTRPVVPFVKTVHERATVEIMRGCPRRCKFCQARLYYGPPRLKSRESVKDIAQKMLKCTGYDELSLLSLSSGDYPEIENLLTELDENLSGRNISLALPSLRVEKLASVLPMYLSRVRKTGLTFAPEAGSDRLRREIGKDINIQYLKEAASQAYKAGYDKVKLYFMIGLPTETDEDLKAIVDLVFEVARLRKKFKKHPAKINLTVSTFIPKPHTEYERLGIISRHEIEHKQAYLRQQLNKKYIKWSFTPAGVSLLEAALCRGGRELALVIKTANEAGACLDAWTEHFNLGVWEEAFKAHGLCLEEQATRAYNNEPVPWGHVALASSKPSA